MADSTATAVEQEPGDARGQGIKSQNIKGPAGVGSVHQECTKRSHKRELTFMHLPDAESKTK